MSHPLVRLTDIITTTFGGTLKKYIAALSLAAALALVGCSAAAPEAASEAGTKVTAAPAPTAADKKEAAPVEAKPAEAKSEEVKVPSDHKSALKSAENYSKIMHMSKAGLFDQLTSEYGDKFSEAAAQYAVDTIEADWNANALASAKTYQESMAMSPEAIRDQLTSEHGDKFTAEQADFAVANLD